LSLSFPAPFTTFLLKILQFAANAANNFRFSQSLGANSSI